MISKKEIRELSKKVNIPEEEVKKKLKEIFDAVSKPSLNNTSCSFDGESGVGPSDKD